MLAPQRYDYMLELLRHQGALRIAEVVAGLGVSDGTVRRDLDELERRGLLRRVHGGAVAPGADTAARVPGPEAGGPADDVEPASASAALPGPVPSPASGAVLGMLVPSTGYYFPAVIEGARRAAAEAGARLVLGVSDYSADRDREQLRALLAAGVDGLLVTGSDGPLVPEPLRRELDAAPVPQVLVERRYADPRDPARPFDPTEHVVTDHRQGAYRAVAHLAGLGHTRIALHTDATPTTRAVREGHADALRLLGLEPDVPQDAADVDGFAQACRAGGVTAALVHGDAAAVLLAQRLHALGVRLPEDFSLVSYDDEVAALCGTPLSAVAPPKAELGRTAVRMLLRRLAEPDAPVRQVVLQPALRLRASTGPAPAARAALPAPAARAAGPAVPAAAVPAVPSVSAAIEPGKEAHGRP